MGWTVNCPICGEKEAVHFYHLLGLPVSCSHSQKQFQIYPGWELFMAGLVVEITFFNQSWHSFGAFLILFCLFLFLCFQPLYRWHLIRSRIVKR